MIDQKLLDILVCPRCKGRLITTETTLICEPCKLKYPIKNGIPVMLIDEAEHIGSTTPKKTPPFESPTPRSPLKTAGFKILEGPDEGVKFDLADSSCRAIGRGETESEKTTVFNVDLTLTLDEGTKILILNYISRQFGKVEKGKEPKQIGSFKRASDIILTDQSLSRLHAMLFSADNNVGVLDLVSKNGTFVNGVEIEGKVLSKGDMIEMGETKITFEGLPTQGSQI